MSDSEYVSMKSIQMKNKLMQPKVLDAHRSGNLNYGTLQDTVSPLQEIYVKSYQYLFYPKLSSEAQKLIQK